MLSFLAALLHIGCIALGPDWFRFFGAPEDLILAYENGDNRLIWVTLFITLILSIWGLYALSGAGRIVRLPLLGLGLVTIAGIYLLRGLLLIPAMLYVPYPEGAFDYWSSAIVLIYAIVHIIGIWKSWPRWSREKP
ncbi:hypothetical protein [Alterisphingorhabdus coralli]|uniref:Uncharacterized protein n=1 Tax=Alterisphingorhabdus coralli TaxID=3071408 RepID=A0AA97FBJ4_9SPHN|nr:hypothetical protein [Parasphingorhabdus sp. SCSIO 66989]WOE76030.1 hypothetical protein RB602_04735 [Parasphingorhabdus sp. SCSIO 66989]